MKSPSREQLAPHSVRSRGSVLATSAPSHIPRISSIALPQSVVVSEPCFVPKETASPLLTPLTHLVAMTSSTSSLGLRLKIFPVAVAYGQFSPPAASLFPDTFRRRRIFPPLWPRDVTVPCLYLFSQIGFESVQPCSSVPVSLPYFSLRNFSFGRAAPRRAFFIHKFTCACFSLRFAAGLVRPFIFPSTLYVRAADIFARRDTGSPSESIFSTLNWCPFRVAIVCL